MKDEIDKAEIERIYKNLLEEFGLEKVEGIKVVGENVERFKEKLIYIAENNIL